MYQVKQLDTQSIEKSQTASKLAAAKLLAAENTALSETELPLSEQSTILEKPERKVSQVTANESVQEEVIAVRNSLETGQLSKLLIEVRTISCMKIAVQHYFKFSFAISNTTYLNFKTQDAPWKKEDIVDFQDHYAGKYHHYITIGYITKNPEPEMLDEKGHFYLSEVPSYEQLMDSDRKLSGDLEKKTSIVGQQVLDESGIPMKTPIQSGESISQDDRVCKNACLITYFLVYIMHA